MFGIPENKTNNNKSPFDLFRRSSRISPIEKLWSVVTFFLGTLALFFVIALSYSPVGNVISPFVMHLTGLKSPTVLPGSSHEVFGFAPYWTIDKLDSVDFTSLTTFAYFGVPILSDGSLDKSDHGYEVFKSDKVTNIFKKAHSSGTRVVLTLTCMDNDTIESFLSNSESIQRTIKETIAEVKSRGIDGVNIDMEYVGTPDIYYRNQFSDFVASMTDEMHRILPGSKVSVSVYASSAKDFKLYDIANLGNSTDNVFMMAYDFAATGSDKAMPTAPLYGYKEGKYSYDIATAVQDFTKKMPAEKIILGVPYYGYNYLIYGEPQVNADTRPSWSWRGQPAVQTYQIAQDNLTVEREGWDSIGKVGWKAYYVPETDTWRMLFLDDTRSLSIKYDFAKEKNLAGIGIWALGFDTGKNELWSVIRKKFGPNNLAENNLRLAEIN